MNDRPEVVVAGLLLRLVLTDGPAPAPPALGGPALAAALGARLLGGRVRLLAAVPAELGPAEQQLLRRLDPEGAFLRPLPFAALRWVGARVQGDNGRAEVVGDPVAWRAEPPYPDLRGRTLVLANGDPKWYAQLLQAGRPRFVALDVHGEWVLAHRAAALQACLSRAHLLTITRRDFEALPSQVLPGVRAGRRGGPALVVKDGARGVRLHADGQRRDRPAPPVARVLTDVGAGDLLLGALAAALAPGPCPPGLDDLTRAYDRCAPTVGALVGSEDWPSFVARAWHD
jgi:sugar/nucleoside kinase (ribokinase family)